MHSHTNTHTHTDTHTHTLHSHTYTHTHYTHTHTHTHTTLTHIHSHRETEQEIHARQRGHLADVRNNNPGLPYVKHFRECGGDHYTITGVEKLRDRDPHLRKAREKYFKRLFDVQMK